jgi:hypothetical protein
MKKFTLVLVLLALGLMSKAQSGMPYLNFSAGNENQSVTGPDSSVYAFKNNRLMKIKKNLTIAWSFDYGGLFFKNLLLSKTGSLFFLTGDKIGKINAATGSLVWAKTLGSISYTYNTALQNWPITPNQVLLNRNNELVVTGITIAGGSYYTGFIMKLDTNGNNASGSAVYPTTSPNAKLDNLHIISDSLGFYKCYFSTYNSFSGTIGYIFTYNSNLNTINPNLQQVDFYGIGSPVGIAPVIANFRKSLTNSTNFYVVCSLTDVTNINFSVDVRKYTSLKKLRSFAILGAGPNYKYSNFCEDKSGSLTITLNKFSGLASGNTEYSVVNLDTNLNRTTASLFYTEPGFFPIYNESLYHFYPQNTYLDSRGIIFPTNQMTLFNTHTPPTCVQNFTLGNSAPCSNACGFQNVLISQAILAATSTVPLLATYSLTTFSSSITPINLPINQNYCAIVLGTEDHFSNTNNSLQLFPNPSSQFVTLEQQTNEELTIIIENSLGQIVKQVQTTQLQTSIDLKDLVNGWYAVRVNSNTTKNVKVWKLMKE